STLSRLQLFLARVSQVETRYSDNLGLRTLLLPLTWRTTKLDVMPLQMAHRQEEERRAQPQPLFAGVPPIRLSSAEDTILAKLRWFLAMGSSPRQWADILGVITRQRSHLDLGYLRAWADTLQVRAELEQALVDAQSSTP